ncbi:MAG: M20/M25/M40 family metallo-hydrolase, partial [Candidatus Hydrogenedentes bacterium]|nr:M20/M25/M40 family metallo-hydrolase [Candidatus Hydrogenedentota bacterium]
LANTKAFALMAHYDSVPYGPGAADDCSGVIAMIEIARALKAGPPLKNDVIFLFTDGEEGRKLGALSFAAHPWFNETGVMVNLESRGTQGNSIMFGTSEQNGWLIENMVAAARYPCASSLGYDVYKRMPFSTDFDVLRPLGMKGFDAAFIGNFAWYHTMNDTPEHLDLGTLQQHGTFGLDLARHFGNTPLDGTLTAPDKMYFNTLGYYLVHYPLSWGGPLAALTLLLTGATLLVGGIRKHISILGVLAGAATWVAAAALAIAVAVLMLAVIWGQETAVNIYTRDFTRIPDLQPLYHNSVYVTAFAAASIAVMTLAYGIMSRWVRPESLAMGAYLWWMAALLAVALYLPGASFLLMWPLAISALGMLAYFLVAKPGEAGPAWITFLSVCALPVVILFPPAYWSFANAILIMAAPGLAAFVTLGMGLLVPQVAFMARVNGWWLPALSASAAAALVMYGLANSSYTPLRPKLNSLSYGINYDTREAFWLSPDPEPDEWTSQFFSADAPREEYSEFSFDSSEKVMKAPAPSAAEYPGPRLVVTRDFTFGTTREVTFHVDSPAKAAHLALRIVSDTEVLWASVFGKPLAAAKKNWRLDFQLFPREGADVTLRIPAGTPVEINVRETFFGLPTQAPGFQPRPGYMICTPNTVNHNGSKLNSNHIWVTQTFEL